MDVLCAVCGEPWDSYSVGSGDMAPWEAALFRRGAGCPCCKGHSPALDRLRVSVALLVELRPVREKLPPFLALLLELYLRASIQVGVERVDEASFRAARHLTFEGSDDDPEKYGCMRRMHELVVGLPLRRLPPVWKRPEDPVLWTCTGCGIELRRDADFAEKKDEVGVHRYWKDPKDWLRADRLETGAQSCDFKTLLEGEDWELWRIDGKPYCPDCAQFCDDCRTLTFEEDLIHDPHDYSASCKAVCSSCYEQIQVCEGCGDWVEAADGLDGEGRCSGCAPAETDEEDAEDEVEAVYYGSPAACRAAREHGLLRTAAGACGLCGGEVPVAQIRSDPDPFRRFRQALRTNFPGRRWRGFRAQVRRILARLRQEVLRGGGQIRCLVEWSVRPGSIREVRLVWGIDRASPGPRHSVIARGWRRPLPAGG